MLPSAFAGILEAEFQKLELKLPADQRDKLATYCTELLHWNRKINLTSLTGVDLVKRLIAEPAWIGAQLGMSGSFADIGSGNGSPAIPLAVTTVVNKAHLIEARMKRAAFLRHLAGKLQLAGVSVHSDRCENVAAGLEPVEWITLQAVALSRPLRESLQLCATPTTQVVWITARGHAPTPSSTMIRVPGSETEAWVFRLDPIPS